MIQGDLTSSPKHQRAALRYYYVDMKLWAVHKYKNNTTLLPLKNKHFKQPRYHNIPNPNILVLGSTEEDPRK